MQLAAPAGVSNAALYEIASGFWLEASGEAVGGLDRSDSAGVQWASGCEVRRPGAWEGSVRRTAPRGDAARARRGPFRFAASLILVSETS